MRECERGCARGGRTPRRSPGAQSRALAPGQREPASVRRWGAADRLRRALQHLARVRVRDERERLVDRHPFAGRDSLLALRARRGVLGFHQKEVADLVDQLSAEAKVPVDGRELPEAAALREVSEETGLTDLVV